METKFTAGPWKYSWRQVDGEADCGVFAEPHEGQAYSVCRAPRYQTEEQWDADARLIAAAPELLEACQTFAEWLRREDAGFIKAGGERDTPEGEAKWREWYHENLRICDLAQTQAIAAIAKATGSQP